jgi:hypothetical protein
MTESDLSGTGIFEVYATIANNNPNQPPMFDEATSWDRSLRPAELTAAVSGFNPVPFASIGPSIPNPASVILEPPVPLLQDLTTTNLEVDLQWSDDGIHPEQQETGFELQRQNVPNGPWQVVQTFGPDVDYATGTGLAASTGYAFRVRSFNAVGSVFSNSVNILTPAPAYVLGTSTNVQAGSPLMVINDVHIKGTVAVSPATQQAGPSVPIFDVGDCIQISFSTNAGLYEIGVRVRSGAVNNPTYFWPAGYEFTLDGNAITLTGDTTTVSPLDSGYGGCYWGTMFSAPMSFTAGTHFLQVTASESWTVVNYLSVIPLVPPQVTTFAQWQQAHFSEDQLTNSAISGWSANPVGDGTTNLLKYALGLDPWTSIAGSGIQVTLVSGQPQLTFYEPSTLTDVSYFVEVSNDLNTWAAVTQTVIGQSSGLTEIQATQTGTPQQFIRLRVTCSSWSTSTPVLPTGVTNVVGVGNPLSVVTSLNILGTVGVSQDTVNNTQCVRLYDIGDAIKVNFASATGSYVIGVRLRSGDVGGTMSYWQLNGYSFMLDGVPLALTGNPSTISGLDTFFGPTYWGTMLSVPLELSQGIHSLVITSNRKWAVAVNLETIPQ